MVQNMSKVGSHLGDIDPRWLEPSYHPGFSLKLHYNGESGIGQGISKEGQQVSSKSCYLYIKCLPPNSLATLMWRWYLNSD